MSSVLAHDLEDSLQGCLLHVLWEGHHFGDMV